LCEQAKPLKQAYGSLSRLAPNKLAVLTVAVLHVGVTAGVFKTTILKCAIDEYAVIKNYMLALKSFFFVSSHL
jgi:hypothetical protein